MIERLIGWNLLKSSTILDAMRKVPREEFMPREYVDYAYLEAPFPIPGDGMQTISCPHSYPLFYEALELDSGDRFSKGDYSENHWKDGASPCRVLQG